jgi:hypothetical protein
MSIKPRCFVPLLFAAGAVSVAAAPMASALPPVAAQ